MKPLAFLTVLSTLCMCSCIPDTGLNAQEIKVFVDPKAPITLQENWDDNTPATLRTALQAPEIWQTVSSTQWLEALSPGYMYPLHMKDSCEQNLEDNTAAQEQMDALRARGANKSVTFACPGRTRWWEDKMGTTYTGPELHKLYAPVESPAEAVSFVQVQEMADATPDIINLPSGEVIENTELAGATISGTYYVRRTSTVCEATNTTFWQVATEGIVTPLGFLSLPTRRDECPTY